jgi:uncharacterized membrane protein YdjX (TVP38/TMEM64 family)
MSRVWIQRIVIAAAWAAAILAWRSYQTSNELSTIETAQRLIDDLDSMWWGPLAYVVAYLARPILLFPASVMTVAGGLLFGPVAGVLLVVVAANASAMLVYLIGRALAGHGASVEAGRMGGSDDARTGLVARWGDRMRTRSFETVFVMRLLFLPYDLVNVVSGALRIRWTSFLAATVLGTIPGTISFVLLGASLERIDDGLGGVNPRTVAASVALFLLSLAIARMARARAAEPVLERTTDT